MATLNEFGYEGLIDEWNSAHSDIKLKQVKVGTWDTNAKANLYTKLAAGSGLSDIEAIEGDAMPAVAGRGDQRVRGPHRPRARRALARLSSPRRAPTPTDR